MAEHGKVELGEIEIEFNMAPDAIPKALRSFAGRTQMDAEIDALDLPRRPVTLRCIIGLLRLYRRIRPSTVGARCVFDPSCSRYAELAFRKHGLVGGMMSTAGRLSRCRHGNGGVDLPEGMDCCEISD